MADVFYKHKKSGGVYCLNGMFVILPVADQMLADMCEVYFGSQITDGVRLITADQVKHPVISDSYATKLHRLQTDVIIAVPTPMVAYQAVPTDDHPVAKGYEYWMRPASEFFDGRFERVPDPTKPRTYRCDFCSREITMPCRSTRDMEDHIGDITDINNHVTIAQAICFAALIAAGGGERTLHQGIAQGIQQSTYNARRAC